MNETLRQKRTRLRLEVLELDRQLARPSHRINPETERMYTQAEYMAWRQRQVMAKNDRQRQLIELKAHAVGPAEFFEEQALRLRNALVQVERWSNHEPFGVIHQFVHMELDRYADACAEYYKKEEIDGPTRPTA